ncbi:MAG: M23 family metallopeptidase [Bacillota bacterium]
MCLIIKKLLFGLGAIMVLFGMLNCPAEAQWDERLFEAEPVETGEEVLPTYYLVNEGDTLCGIARRYGVGPEVIAQANNLSRYDLIYGGQYLVVPAGGLVHSIVPGDTLWNIAAYYGVTIDEILGVNNLGPDDVLTVGAELIIPTPLSGLPASEGRGERVEFARPVSGLVSSPFGTREGRLHEGMDIAADTGTPVTAAADGQVIYASPAGTYGNLVIISHAGGWSTYYAHCDRIEAAVGQNVTAGEIIAAVGSTGHSTGPHLHFEVRYNGVPEDPASFLQ